VKPRWFSARKVQLTLGSAVLCLVVVTIVSFRGLAAADASAVSLRHTHRVLEALQDLLLAADGLDASAREYGLTGQDSYLQLYKASRQTVKQDQLSLRELTADNSEQQLHLAGLEWLTSQKISHAEAILKGETTNHFDLGAEAGKSAAEDVLNDMIHKKVSDIRGEELGLLELRDAKAKRQLTIEKALLISATCIGLLIVALAGWSHYRESVQQDLASVALHNSEEKYRSLLDGIDEYAVFQLDPSGTIVSWNAGAQQIHGYSAEEIVGQNFARLFPEEDVQRGRPQHILRLAEMDERYQAEIPSARRDGSTFLCEVAVTALRDSSGKLRGFSKIGHDLTARNDAENILVTVAEQLVDLAHVAEHDPLTGLPNRLLLKDRVNQGIALAHRHSGKVAVLFLDLDGFKHINDSLGHSVGDELLCSVARRLMSCVRSPDTVSRNGGDEFILVIQDMKQPNQAAVTARRVLRVLADPHKIGDLELHVTASIGVSVYPEDGLDAETLIKNADTAMYQAKANGRMQFQFFTPRMNETAVERQSIEEGLRHALEHGEFKLHYQPKIDVKSGAVVGAEALIRWEHPVRGQLPPSTFIPVAEETGLILPIGAWVLREACSQSRSWKNEGLSAGGMAVNVSSFQFQDKGFVPDLTSILKETGMDPQDLELEVTESVLMKDTEASIATLKAIRDVGVRVSIDDFGTGYSSLSYLRGFSLDALKIDQSFLRKIHVAPDDATIVSAIIGLGRAIGLQVVAEGVETAEDLDFLKANDCDEAQGFYFSQPVIAEEFVKLLSSA